VLKVAVKHCMHIYSTLAVDVWAVIFGRAKWGPVVCHVDPSLVYQIHCFLIAGIYVPIKERIQWIRFKTKFKEVLVDLHI